MPAHFFRPCPPLPLLAAPAHLLAERGAAPHVQHARAFWATKLMSGKAQKVYIEALTAGVERIRDLHSVCVQGNTSTKGLGTLADGPSAVCHELDRPHLA